MTDSAPDVGRLIEGVRTHADDIRQALPLTSADLDEAADALAALQAREHDHEACIKEMEQAFDASLEQALKRAEQAEADAASLRQEVERLKIEQTRADIYGEVVAEWRPIVQEAEALRQAQARLETALTLARTYIRDMREMASAMETKNTVGAIRASADSVLPDIDKALASVDPLPQQVKDVAASAKRMITRHGKSFDKLGKVANRG